MTRKRLFGTNGIRGVVNKELTPEFVTRAALAIGTYFSGKSILLGMDARTSSEAIANIFKGALAMCGVEVHDVGLIMTPALQYLVKKHRFDGGVMITASHNPPEYNGIKVIASDGIEIPREEEEKIEELFYEERFKRVEYDAVGSVYDARHLVKDYIDDVVSRVDAEAIAKRGFKVVIDCANSVTALIVPKILRKLGVRAISINAHLDGTFPGREPEPLPENLTAAAKLVVETGADFGVAYDGDGDRSIFISDTGEVVWGDRSGAVISATLLKERGGGKVVTPVSSSILVEEYLRRFGGEVIWTKVGSIIVSRTIVRERAVCGFEENGGFFYTEHHPVRDGGMTTALMLHILAREGRKLSEIIAELPRYYLKKDKVRVEGVDKEVLAKEVISELDKRFEGKKILIDGIKVIMNDGWFLVRPSGTEPLLRIFVEGKSPEIRDRLYREVMSVIQDVIKRIRR